MIWGERWGRCQGSFSGFFENIGKMLEELCENSTHPCRDWGRKEQEETAVAAPSSFRGGEGERERHCRSQPSYARPMGADLARPRDSSSTWRQEDPFTLFAGLGELGLQISDITMTIQARHQIISICRLAGLAWKGRHIEPAAVLLRGFNDFSAPLSLCFQNSRENSPELHDVIKTFLYFLA